MRFKMCMFLGTVLVIISAFRVADYQADLITTNRYYNEIREEVVGRDKQPVTKDTSLASWFKKLEAMNKDFVGWISDGNYIDYPVVSSNSDYYSNHSFNKNSSVCGCLYTGNETLDEDCTIVYGNNVEDGSMFGKLDEYTLGTRVTLYTLIQQRQYEVKAICKCSNNTLDYAGYAGPLTKTDYKKLAKDFSEYLLQGSLNFSHKNKVLILSASEYTEESEGLVVILEELK